MKIRICIQYYDQYDACIPGLKEVQDYKGEHKFEIMTAKGTNDFDKRNAMVCDRSEISIDNPEIKDFDAFLFIDSDIAFTLQDVLTLIEHDKDIIGLPYELRGSPNLYNVGSVYEREMIHYPKTTKGLSCIPGQGMGFRLIKKQVFEKIKPYWFYPEQISICGKLRTILCDYAFDRKARMAGFDVWCDFDHPVEHKMKKEKNMQKTTDISASARRLCNNLSDAQKLINTMVDIIDKYQEMLSESNKKLESLQDKVKVLEEINKVTDQK